MILTNPHGIVHLFWRCHDKQDLFTKPGARDLYLASLKLALKHRGTDNAVALHAICLMSNHLHQQLSYTNGPEKLSHFMRITNGVFGARFNKKFKRSGKVANERPKTPLIGDQAYEMRAHFYIEANPIRAGLPLEKLTSIPWNSYRFYAYGIVDEWTSLLTPPRWYIELGNSPEERQAAYRKLFREYLERDPKKWPEFLDRFVGNIEWVKERTEEVLQALRRMRSNRNEAPPEARGSPA